MKLYGVLSQIVVWILLLLGIQGIIWTFVAGSNESAMKIVAFFSLWVGTLFLSVVAMKLSQTLKS